MNAVSVDLSDRLGDCGCGGACTGNGRKFTIDTPVMRGLGSALPVTRTLGHVMGIDGLSQVQPNTPAGPIMSRASNVTNLTVLMLMQLEPRAREAALTELGGFNWSNDVLRAANTFPGEVGPKERLRGSLALHFLAGVLDAENGKSTQNARAYLAFARLFKDAQGGRGEKQSSVQSLGLGSLGAAQPGADETSMADDHAWCAANKGKEYPAGELEKCKRCAKPAGLPNSKKNNYNYAEWYGAYLCKKPAPSTAQGRKDRGMTQNYVPPITYPAPPNITSVDLKRFQVANCGAVGFDQDRNDKKKNIIRLFKQVFGRDPNNAEVQYYGEAKWCANNNDTIDSSMGSMMVNVRTAIVDGSAANTTPNPSDSGPVKTSVFATRTAGGDAAASIQQAAQAAFDFAGKSVDFIINSVCAAFKQVFGPVIGGALCEVITLVINSYAALAQALVVIVQEAFTGIIDSLKFMGQGKWQEAMMALLKAVGRMLFALSAPVSVPLLMGTTPGMTRDQAFALLRKKADRVTNKNPLFPITLVMAIVQLGTGPSIGTIVGVTLSISPMIAVFAAEPLLTNKAITQWMSAVTLDAMETAVENIIKMLCIIVQGLMKLPEILPKLKGQLSAVVQRKAGKGAAGIADMVINSVKAFEAGFKSVNDAITKFQFQQVTASAVQLLNTVPLMLAAFVGPEEMAAGAVPSISDWMAANEAAGRSVDEQQRALAQASTDFLNKLPFPQAMLVAVERTTDKNVTAPERAKAVALIVGNTYKQDKQAFTNAFIPAFKAELLKV